MPIVVFAVILAILIIVYYFFVSNESLYTKEKPKANDPFDVIYLPDDLDAEKNGEKQNDNKNDDKKEGRKDEDL